jgi:hypothetical protein
MFRQRVKKYKNVPLLQNRMKYNKEIIVLYIKLHCSHMHTISEHQ